MKVGDLVKCPDDGYYWWGGKVAIIVGIEDQHRHDCKTLRLLVAGKDPGHGYAKFGANFVELLNEAR